jgi:hypothetical protein
VPKLIYHRSLHSMRAGALSALGLCTRCRRANADSEVYQVCADCVADVAAHNHAVRTARRAAGLCYDCGLPSPRFRCAPCRAKAAEHARSLRRRRREAAAMPYARPSSA